MKARYWPCLSVKRAAEDPGHMVNIWFIFASDCKEAEMNIRYRVELGPQERAALIRQVRGGRLPVRRVKRARIPLAADDGCDAAEIARRAGVGGSTVYRVKRRFVELGLEAALGEAPRPGVERKLPGREEALLVATAGSDPPEGRAGWTLELLADAMVRLTEHDSPSRETVRRLLSENALKPWREEMWCVAEVDAEYVARMEDVLDLYAEAPDPEAPVVCFDESPTQLIGEARHRVPAAPGRRATITGIAAMARPICSCSSTPIARGAA